MKKLHSKMMAMELYLELQMSENMPVKYYILSKEKGRKVVKMEERGADL
jgi:hypothetical protein